MSIEENSQEGNWYFSSLSDPYGSEEFGPYDTFTECVAGIQAYMRKALGLKDGVVRYFSLPYQKKEDKL